jgi:hypothetical protein
MGSMRISQHTIWMPASLRAAGTAISRTILPDPSVNLSLRSLTGFFRWIGITASIGGFSPTKYWWPQNSSFRSSLGFHSSAVGTENNMASEAAVRVAVYS